jgi:hypothetical protein
MMVLLLFPGFILMLNLVKALTFKRTLALKEWVFRVFLGILEGSIAGQMSWAFRAVTTPAVQGLN